MEELIKTINTITKIELKRANKKFPPFNSNHEAYAVLKEEIEEAREESGRVTSSLEMLWERIKLDSSCDSLINICEYIKKHSILEAAESIQVAAMCQKFIDLEEILE